MNNFDIVLEIIKNNCNNAGVPCEGCMHAIKQKLDATYHEHIDFYLGFLHDLGLILYDVQQQEITLTETGKNTKGIFV